MKIYIVEWKYGEDYFENINEAIRFAEYVSDTEGVNSYVFVEKDGIKEDEPFFKNEVAI
ncbi:hypothetical protein [Robertmurraya siralis]|uniref:hypothetical protein n=1 Tax=Robertmurraya siralis TaxID=77777 RepID=UPI001476B111|nr:hypothetical protein [Robertmurraya siralis]